MMKLKPSPNIQYLVLKYYAGRKALERIEKDNFYFALTDQEKGDLRQASLKDAQVLNK